MSHIKIKLHESQLNFIKDTCKEFNYDPGELINILHK